MEETAAGRKALMERSQNITKVRPKSTEVKDQETLITQGCVGDEVAEELLADGGGQPEPGEPCGGGTEMDAMSTDPDEKPHHVDQGDLSGCEIALRDLSYQFCNSSDCLEIEPTPPSTPSFSLGERVTADGQRHSHCE
ncbi:hypothetical protein V5799_007742 [Amblyomma americanum]|uniref:Uncharacterized protein n=1 Tax=Amblyomma americanum TaxID=6943 RepID=A0AAQ4FGG6_AMBAM